MENSISTTTTANSLVVLTILICSIIPYSISNAQKLRSFSTSVIPTPTLVDSLLDSVTELTLPILTLDNLLVESPTDDYSSISYELYDNGFVGQSLNTSLLSPYLDSLGGNFLNGANFAIAGSTTLPRNVPFSLNIQVMQFNHFKDRSSELVAAGVGKFTANIEFSNGLYMIDIGQNDISDSFARGLSFAQVVWNIPSVLAEIKNAIKEMYDLKGRNFWIHNTGPLGCLPQKLALLNNASQDMDSMGCISSYNKAAKVFNEGLFQLTETLRSEMKEAVIVYVDIYAIKSDLIANSNKYGFSSSFMACCGSGGPPYNYERGVICGFPGCQVCNQASRLVSGDGVHYTEAANAFIASKILSANYSTPKVTFDFFCR